MKLFSRHQNQKTSTPTLGLVMVVLLLNLIVFGLAGISSYSSYQGYLLEARTDANNLSQVLQQNFDGLLEKVDAVLYSTALIIEKQIEAGAVDKKYLNGFMAKQKEHIPRANSLRATDASGNVIYGTNVPVSWTRNLAKREYFQSLRDNPKVPFLISDPVTGGISGKRVMVLARRINKPDGSFAGVVYAPVTVKTIAEIFSRLELSKESIVALRKGFGDFAILVRRPEIISGTINSSHGSSGHSSEYGALVSRGDKSHIYETASGVDGIYRTYAVRRLEKFNYYVAIGIAHDDVLASWKRESIQLIAIAMLFLAASIIVATRIKKYIIAQQAHQAELEKVAHYDPLTGLPNRRLLSDRIERGVARSLRNKTNMAVCMIDLDDFKSINDQFGHEFGDQVLVSLTQHIKQVLRADDTLARIGGDEFVLLLELEEVNEIRTVLDRVFSSINRPVSVQGTTYNFSASIGVALFPDDDVNPDTLLRHADQAMYLAKRTAKNSYRLFDSEHDQQIQAHIHYRKRLQEALENNEFVLHYQPKVDMVSGEVVGAEALIRWQHPEEGFLFPDSFLPQVSGTPLEIAIGNWVIRSALFQINHWKSAGVDLSVSVNISAGHLLHASFIDELQQVLTHFPNVSPEQVEFEILETAAISDLEQAIVVLESCKKLGVKISLDDFGTGYSSLTYLRSLPVDILKIDREFVRDMLSNPADLDIVISVVQLAKTFNRVAIAEGVETLEQGEKLLDVGCRFMQGFGIARPMPADQLEDWTAQWKKEAIWERINQKSS